MVLHEEHFPGSGGKCVRTSCEGGKGAAMMTETELEIEFLGAAITQNNHVLAGVVAEAMNKEIPQEPWTQEELDFAAAPG